MVEVAHLFLLKEMDTLLHVMSLKYPGDFMATIVSVFDVFSSGTRDELWGEMR